MNVTKRRLGRRILMSKINKFPIGVPIKEEPVIKDDSEMD
jgi:hypothetical protein